MISEVYVNGIAKPAHPLSVSNAAARKSGQGKPAATTNHAAPGSPESACGLPHPRYVRSAAGYRFVKIDVSVAYLHVEAAGRIAAYPCLIVHRCPLAAVVRKRTQLAHVALQASWKNVSFHNSSSQSKTCEGNSPVYFLYSHHLTTIIRIASINGFTPDALPNPRLMQV